MKTANKKLPIADCRLPITGQFRAPHSALRTRLGFTLIELLTVIAIMAVIAAMIFPIAAAVKKQQYLKTPRAELEQIATALDDYKQQYGSYPPGNPLRPGMSPLYYELIGVTNVGGNYVTLDGATTISASTYNTTFNVGGAVNCAKPGGDPEAARAKSFLTSLKQNRIGVVDPTVNNQINVLMTSVPTQDPNYRPLGVPDVNPFCYVYPGTNNPSSYDLWIDVKIGAKTNRISNWRSAPYTL